MTLTPELPVLVVSSCSPGLVVYCKPRPPYPQAFLRVSRGSQYLKCAHGEVQPIFWARPLCCGGVPARCPNALGFRVSGTK